MQFGESQSGRTIGVVVGYAFSYFLFTTILYWVLFLLKKLPTSWFYIHIMAITATIAVLGFGIRRLLK
jgi:hypothetical protein